MLKMILLEPETPETILIDKENKAKLYAAIESLQYSEIVKHYLTCGNCSAVGRKYNLSRTRIQNILYEAVSLITKRLNEKTK